MAFLRNSNRERYTVIDNEAIRDDNLSLKALGLLVKLLSFPDNWEFSENGLEKIFKQDGQTSIRSGLKELEKHGYLKREKIRDEKGRIKKVEWQITENPHFENHNLDIHSFDNRPQSITNVSNTNQSITNDCINDSDTVADSKNETDNSDCPYKEILNLYHSICISYPKLRTLTDKRKKQIKARWKEYKDIEIFKEIFKKAENSSYLKGNNKDQWKASFDWLMKPDMFVRTLEGNYDINFQEKPKSKKQLPTEEDYNGEVF